MSRPRTVSDEAILAATAETIARVGPDGLTLRAIAEQTDLSPSALVQRFGSKRELLLALAEGAPDALAQRIERATEETDAPLEALVELLIEESSSFASSPQAAANHLAFLQIDLDDPEFRTHAVRHLELLEEGIRALLLEAVDLGHLGECDVSRLARSVLVTYCGSLISWAILREKPLDGTLREHVRAVLAPHVAR